MGDIITYKPAVYDTNVENCTIPFEITALAYKSIYKAKRGTFYVGRVGYNHLIQDISWGLVPYSIGENIETISPKKVSEEQDKIKELVENDKVIALSEVKEPKDMLSLHHQDCSILYLKGEKELIGGGYLSKGESSDVSDKMLAFIMYYIARSMEDDEFEKAIRRYIVLKYGVRLNVEFAKICNMKSKNNG